MTHRNLPPRPLRLVALMASSSFMLGVSSAIDHGAEAIAQYEILAEDLTKQAHFERFKDETFHPSALIMEADRDPLDVILRRTRVLLEDIRAMEEAPDLEAQANGLKQLRTQSEAIAPESSAERLALFKQVHGLRRNIAFSNPQLDFESLLFIKRDRATYNHMCDQYYGINARPGGGVFALVDPIGGNPREVNLLENAVVESGRLKGTKLDVGGVLSPELSYDGRTVYFSYVEGTDARGHVAHEDHAERGHWARGRCYHLFSCEIDPQNPQAGAKALRQLTDGTFNDFDPCPLPNGRVAFISERRGGYLRCGRACPSYTVFDMLPDGSDIRVLSPHENNEWQPSVNHDGMLIYTRWDYVDRHGCTAHHPWIMSPDGRNSRAMHGNFSIKSKRADMEMDLRPIPGSRSIIGTAAPHHGQSYGSIIIHDPHVPDDDAMAPVKRMTPEVGFPESQGGREVYGTPWPLSENYQLCVYDPAMQYGAGSGKELNARRDGRGNYGIYLLDAFGNKVLIHRDSQVSCLSPMPLRARMKPPLMPDRSERLADAPPAHGTMAVLDVYDSRMPWPEGTKIKALRIYQVMPSSVPSGRRPHETGRRIAEASDSVNLARRILGTVPVEKDGSAHFQVPALKEVFFQALDENGLAVQSMRSSTWVQPGEQMVCHGCHESDRSAPTPGNDIALALKRPPSIPKPDVSGTNPFSYPQLVQPVLDRNCVECHAENAAQGAPPLDSKVVGSKLGGRNATPVYRSYDSLIHEFAFWRYGDNYRTRPGEFGARASKLHKLLSDGHYDVDLDKKDMHRITVWLDSLSNFYGVYEKEAGEAQLRGETVQPGLE